MNFDTTELYIFDRGPLIIPDSLEEAYWGAVVMREWRKN